MVKCDLCNKEATKDAMLKQGGWAIGKTGRKRENMLTVRGYILTRNLQDDVVLFICNTK